MWEQILGEKCTSGKIELNRQGEQFIGEHVALRYRERRGGEEGEGMVGVKIRGMVRVGGRDKVRFGVYRDDDDDDDDDDYDVDDDDDNNNDDFLSP